MGTGTTSASAQTTTARRERIERLKLAVSPTVLLEHLQRDWRYLGDRGLRITGCEVVRVHPRGDDEFVLEYELCLAGPEGEQVQRIFGELVGDGAQQRYEEAVFSLQKPRRWQLTGQTSPDSIACIPRMGMVVRLPGLDERIYGLKFVYKPRKLRPYLAEHVVAPDDKAKNIEAQLLGHRLGKRCTVRFRFDAKGRGAAAPAAHSIIAKMYKARSERGSEVAAVMHRLRKAGFDASSSIRIPAPIAYLPDWQIFLMEDAPGDSLAELRGPRLTAGIAAAGQTLAKLHGCPLHVADRHAVDDELALLAKWVDLVGEVDGELREPTVAAMQVVRSALAPYRDAPVTLVHRDFYDKQVLVGDGETVLIDFDTLCMADPAIDVGNFLAHVVLARAQGLGVDDGAEHAFTSSYSGGATCVGGDFDGRVAAYTKSTLLRLVCLYSFWPRYRQAVAALLGELQ